MNDALVIAHVCMSFLPLHERKMRTEKSLSSKQTVFPFDPREYVCMQNWEVTQVYPWLHMDLGSV